MLRLDQGGSLIELIVTHEYAGAGSYTITLSAESSAGARSVSVRGIAVGGGDETVATASATPTATDTPAPPPTPINNPPELALSAVDTAGLEVGFSVTATDPDGVALLSIEWGDGVVETVSGSSDVLDATATYEYAAGGAYTIRIAATDDAGATGEVEVAVLVSLPPRVSNVQSVASAAYPTSLTRILVATVLDEDSPIREVVV